MSVINKSKTKIKQDIDGVEGMFYMTHLGYQEIKTKIKQDVDGVEGMFYMTHVGYQEI